MMKPTSFSVALRMALAVALLLPACVGALSQDAAPAAPSGAKAQSILGLQSQHITLSVANFKLERDWYIEKLGFTLAPPMQMGPGPGPGSGPNSGPPPGPMMQMAQVTIPGYRIDLMQFPGSRRPKDASPRYAAQGWVHIAFTVANLDKALSFLEAAGTDVKGNRGGNNALMGLLLHDPEGNEIEIFSR